MLMPEPDQESLAKRKEIVAALRRIVPGEGVIAAEDELRAYECDALSAYRAVPMAVVLPSTVEQVSAVLQLCDKERIKVVPRGAGTSLSGGSLPLQDGIVLGMGKFNRILDVDYENRTVTAQPGVTNLGITRAVEEQGFYYAPDPSSQIACSIGGNIAENSGGVHCLKYGLTTNNVLGIEMVLPNGEVVRLGGKHLDSEGYDLLGLMTGSEGLLGVVTEVTVRILARPETARAVLMGFPSNEKGGDAVASIIAAGIIPGGLEMMDRPAIHAAEDFCHAGYPARRRGAAHLRAGRAGTRGRPPDRRRDRHRPPAWRHLRQGLGERGGAQPLLARSQGRLPCRRPHLARLYLHGRHDPQEAALSRAAADRGAVGRAWAARRQRVPRRRRQSPPADPLRCQQAGRAREAPSGSAPTSSHSAWRWAGCSRASTASVSRSAT